MIQISNEVLQVKEKSLSLVRNERDSSKILLNQESELVLISNRGFGNGRII